jgi:hypothetical protein
MPSRWSHSCCTTRAWKPAARLDHGVDQHGEVLLAVAGQIGRAFAGDEKRDDAVRRVDLRRGDAGTAGVVHRLKHVADQPADPRRGRVVDRRGAGAQHRMTHAGYFQQSHAGNM